MTRVLRQRKQRDLLSKSARITQFTNRPSTPKTKATKKWDQYSEFAKRSPFPDFHRPSSQECYEAHRILAKLHGDRNPTATDAMNADGIDRPSVFKDPLDGLIYGILCQATNERNAIRQIQSMNDEYGSWTNYNDIVNNGETKLQGALACRGLHLRKSKFIMSILHQVKARHDSYTLNHLWPLEDEQVMEEFLSYDGVGPKTASCVLALTLNRERFVVDTHIYRITGFLGWRPMHATAEQARAHLETKIPDDLKYALHLLFITHGRECPACKAGGKPTHKCELREAFRDQVSKKDQ
ncbi:Base excision DNA repair protein [Penicillium sp. IBT 18751x]|nr:Base excision DNA repair protein [Penicillium sp. IBT 18751x]